MLKRHSTLDTIYTPGKNPFNNITNITFKELVNLNLKQITCWPNTYSDTENFFKKELNIQNIPDFNKGIIEKEFSLWRIEPLKWWILDKDIYLTECEHILLIKLINKRNNLVSREELANEEFDESELRKVDVGITR